MKVILPLILLSLCFDEMDAQESVTLGQLQEIAMEIGIIDNVYLNCSEQIKGDSVIFICPLVDIENENTVYQNIEHGPNRSILIVTKNVLFTFNALSWVEIEKIEITNDLYEVYLKSYMSVNLNPRRPTVSGSVTLKLRDNEQFVLLDRSKLE